MGHIKATLHTDKLHGNVARGITVQTDDRFNAVLRLTIRASIVSSVVVYSGESLTFSNLSPRQNRTRLLVRRDPTESGELKVGDVKPSAEWFTVEATRLQEPRPAGDGLPAGQPGDWLLEGKLVGNPPYGVTRARLSFATGLPRQPRLELPVLGNLRPPVQLTAEPVELRASEGQPAEATVLFSIRQGLEPEGLQVESEPEKLEVQVEKTGRRFYKALVRWNGGQFPGGALVFRHGDERYRVPVRLAPSERAGG